MADARRRLAIVGNGPLAAGARDRIETADAVIRFNDPVHSPALAGSRTDILFLVNSGKSMQRRLQDAAFFTSPFFLAAREIILPYDPEVIRKYHPKPNPLSRLKGRRADWTEQSRTKFEQAGKQVSVLPASFYAESCEALGIAEADRRRVFPSTGFLGIRYGRLNFPEPEWSLEIFGFSWEGWKRHDWPAERAWVDSHVVQRNGQSAG